MASIVYLGSVGHSLAGFWADKFNEPIQKFAILQTDTN
jgi:hypothetical protein